jgi:hypothetical protein
MFVNHHLLMSRTLLTVLTNKATTHQLYTPREPHRRTNRDHNHPHERTDRATEEENSAEKASGDGD